MSKQTNRTTRSFRLTQTDDKRLNTLAAHWGLNRTQAIRRAVDLALSIEAGRLAMLSPEKGGETNVR